MASEEDHTQFSSFISVICKGQACYSPYAFYHHVLFSVTVNSFDDRNVKYQGSNAIYKYVCMNAYIHTFIFDIS